MLAFQLLSTRCVNDSLVQAASVIASCSRPSLDLRVQTSADDCLNRLPPASNIYLWVCMGRITTCLCSERHPVILPGTCDQLREPRTFRTKRGGPKIKVKLMVDCMYLFQHAVASLIASTAASGSSSVMNFAVQRVQSSFRLLHSSL